MAEEKKPEGGDLKQALPVTVVLALIAALTFTHYLPYQDERPTNRPIQAQYDVVQDVDARLWQDPFAAVDDANEGASTENVLVMTQADNKTLQWEARPIDKSPSHTKKQIYDENNLAGVEEVTVVAVTLPGGPYQEAAEQRMRWRYAVLSALANQGAMPEDEQHIGYFRPEPEIAFQKKIPFEWWLREDNTHKILLLWIDETSLTECPAAKLKKLLNQIKPNKPELDTNFKVMGPNTSTLLRSMLKEVAAAKNAQSCTNYSNIPSICADQTQLEEIQKPIVYYSATATATDQKLLAGIGSQENETVSDYLSKLPVPMTLYRTTSTEQEMMESLVAELKLRQIKDTEQIAILSEWDTFYGRAIPETFKDTWGKKNKVTLYKYMRGLDGKLPEKGDKAAGAEKKPDSKDQNKSDATAPIEFPQGSNQKDYLRRLAKHIFEDDQNLKRQGQSKGIAAIGVLGSDVHDKLIILEALRQYFPHKQFFTTDLDAAYFHPSKWDQTHNLLVVSAYDLTLLPELQSQIPPFRDSYQTALFLATQLMLNEYTIPTAPKPLLFEIGRSRPIPLPTNDEQLPENNGGNRPQCTWDNWRNCNQIVHPPVTDNYQLNWNWPAIVGIAIAIFCFCYCVSLWFRKRAAWFFGLCKSHPFRIVGFSAASLMTPPLILQWINLHNSEPFYWLEGVSIWPSQLLRLSVIVFAGIFFWYGHRCIKTMQEELQAQPGNETETQPTFELPSHPDRIDAFDIIFSGNWKQNDNPSVLPRALWRKYLGYLAKPLNSTFPGWLSRTLVHSFFFLVAAVMIISVSGLPNTPVRGEFAANINTGIIFMAVIATTTLITKVVQNARLCHNLIVSLSEKPSEWHKQARNWAQDTNKIAPECVNEWLDIQLVARLTETMQRLIWGPILCIALLLMARSPVIDDWDIPWGLEVVLGSMLIYSFSAEVFLQKGANAARKKAIEQLTLKISERRNQNPPDPSNKTTIKRIEAEIKKIKDLRDGAFKPWYEWPLLQSFGGLGTLWFALQYLAKLWGNGDFGDL